MASLAEYCGIWPTAGGQQFYVQVLASPKWRPLLSYLVGWALMTAEMSIGSSCAIQNANIIGSFIQTVHPDFVWTVSKVPIVVILLSLNMADAILKVVDELPLISILYHSPIVYEPPLRPTAILQLLRRVLDRRWIFWLGHHCPGQSTKVQRRVRLHYLLEQHWIY